MSENKKMKSLVDEITVLFDSLKLVWEADRERYPILRRGIAQKWIDQFEVKSGATLPSDFKAFLSLVNGMEGASGSEWIIRGTSEPKSGQKFKTVERDFLPEESYEPRFSFMRDESSPSADNALLIATNFNNDVAVIKKVEGDDDVPVFSNTVYLYQAPDLIEPYMEFDSFVDFLSFVVETYKVLLDNSQLDDFDDELDDEPFFDDDEEFAKYDDPYAYAQAVEELDLIEDYDEDEEPISEGASTKKSSTKKSGNRRKPMEEELEHASDDELLAFLQGLHAGRGRAPITPQEAAASPETQRAIKLVEYTVSKLIDEGFLELVEKPKARADLEEILLKKLFESPDQKSAVRNWFQTLLTAKEVEDLYGTDADVKNLLTKAFEDFE